MNRRVTLRPPIDLKVRDFVDVTQEKPIPGKKPSTSLGEPAPQPPVPEPPEPPTPPLTVSRKTVRDALRDWLLELGKTQKLNAREADVLSTSRVYVAEETLNGRPLGEDTGGMSITPPNGDGRAYRAADLADRIANNLPDEIPRVNFDNFLKMHAREAPADKSTTQQIRDKLDEKADEVLSKVGVPKQYWDDVKKAVRSGTSSLLDKLPAGTAKDLAKKAYDTLTGDDKSQ
jgi:hypothetical protein